MLKIDRLSRSPVYEQIIEQFEYLIMSGDLKEGEKLPSVRALSQELSINPNTIQKSFVEMERRGLCITSHGSGRYITNEAKNILVETKRSELSGLKQIITEFMDAGISKKEIFDNIKTICDEIETKQKEDEKK